VNAVTRRLKFVQRTLVSLAALSITASFSHLPVSAASQPDLTSQALQREAAGDLDGARAFLEQQAGSGAHEALAEFLQRHHDPNSRDAYLKWAAAEQDPAQRKLALRQVVLNDFMDGKEAEMASDLAQYRAAGGTDLAAPPKRDRAAQFSTATIPGPLPAFARMAALSPDLAPEELLPALARNVATNGYEASGNAALQQTEYLRLVFRYLGQARELQALATHDRKIVIATCDSEETGNLLKALGYRMRGSCGGDLVLETVNATKAFLTVDSGFPISELEADLRANHRFELPYAPTQVPVLYTPAYWLSALGRNNGGEFIDAFLSDPSLCRLYLGLSHLDHATAEALRKQASAAKLKLYANVLDFYGSMFQIKNGAAVVPGSPKAWASVTGASPSNPGQFFEKLISTDDGWAASYFDALSRIDGPTAAYLTQPERMRRFYDALRGKITVPGPARPVFRSSTELVLLTTSLRVNSNGQPHIPGDLEVWRTLFVKHPHGKYDGKLTRSAASWRSSDDLLESLFALSRKTVENEPLKIFLALNDIDRNRAKPISSRLAARLVSAHRIYGSQYSLFADGPGLSEASMNRFLDTCADMSSIRDTLLKADTVGSFQALVELWRIAAIRNDLSGNAQDTSFAKLIAPFGHVRQEQELFDADRSALDALLLSMRLQATGSSRQEQLVEYLVGKLHSADSSAPFSPAENFLRVFDTQRLVSLDNLFVLGDRKGNLDAKTLKSINAQIERVTEAESARGSLSSEERNSFAVGYWSTRHVDQERKFNLDKALKGGDKKDIREALAPFLRDSLVGLLYSYYAPAGAQLLLTNPQFVRSHDFIGPENSAATWRMTEVAGSGWPASAGGRLTGSLASLPYAVAEAEQNFLTPRREQALIWADLVPQMIADVTITRWRDIKPVQVRWVSLHIQRGRNLLATAALDPAVEGPVLNSYSRFTTPAKVEWLQEHLGAGHFSETVSEIPPSVLYALGEDPSLQNISPDAASEQMKALATENASELNAAVIGRSFGTPKPTLTHSYQPGLLHLRTFPALMGYSSRLLAESWESNNLYYAALADEMGIPMGQLDAYVPDWNRSTIENIFATHLEDWPALLRSLHTTANSVRQRNSQAAAVHASAN
jgi:hypothetical protein